MLIDNKKSSKLGEVLKDNIQNNCKLSIISSYFTLYGFFYLKKALEKVQSARIIINSKQFKDDLNLLISTKSEIKLKNNFQQAKIAKECYEWLRQKAQIKDIKIENSIPFNLYHLQNLNNNNFAVQGSSNLSSDGLGYTHSNIFAMNIGINDYNSTKDLLNSFDEIWNNEDMVEDIKDDILKNLENIFKYNSPQFVYFMTLYNIFKDFVGELDEDKIIKTKTGFKDTLVWNKLYNFQKDGVLGAIDKLEKYNGCIIADSVGLGKTFEALAVIKYYELRNDRVLVLCPKKLRENWTLYTVNDKRNVLNKDRFNYDVLNHTDLSRTKGYSGEINLSTLNWSNYDLIVIDESHNFRNTSTNKKTSKSRYAFLLEEVLQKGVKTKVLMLSATPVNNRLNDLKNQLYFITEGKDESFKEFGIKSIEQTLRKAQNKFNQWLELPNSDRTTNNLLDKLNFDYFKLLDLITIARSRKHITKYYNTKDIGKFPERLKPINHKPDIDTLNQFPALSEINKTIRKLTLCAYSPLKYVLPFKLSEYEEKYDIETHSGSKFKQIDRENSLIHLMRVNLLKRMESSINSFTLTVEKLLKRNEDLLKMIESHSSSEISEMSIVDIDIEDDEYADRLIGNKVKVLISDIDKIKWMQDIQNDILKLQELYKHAKKISQDRDLKLQTLKNVISNKIQNPINANNKKIIIFTAFADTAMYLYEVISKAFLNHNIHSCLITGSGNNKTTFDTKDKDLNSLLTHFSPVSKEREKIDTQTQGEIDILIATDCISEGQNLQDCDYLINYDIHWNPVRIIQRFGRVDRLGSKNDKIQLVNFWANMELDEYINLESRVSGRMVLLDVSATGEENVIDVSNQDMNDLSYRAKQLKELQTQVVDLEDVSGNISITDLTLNDFRMDLMNYLKEHKNTLEKTPLGINSIVKNQLEELQDKKGVIYCLRMLSEQNNTKDTYSLEPYYLVYVDENNEVKLSYSNAKNILDIYKKLTLGNDDIQSELFKSFENETKDYSNMNHYVEGLQNSIENIIGKKDEKGLDSLFSGGGTNITSNSFTGSEDFEIVSYLVIR
ncbi:helicase-related protein [Aliarcobacter cryaerophilus]|uniref:helicase-related protein n=1 Tax=Aliarcobacter cryaerophilus TaxID=28198 RepID=UPI000832C1E0|nr:helicase-related protein [Aliarcobacter cryaerophilus]